MAAAIPLVIPEQPNLTCKEKIYSCCESVMAKIESFMQRNFALILFTVSCISLFVASPVALIVGTIAGALINWRYNPDLRLGGDDKIVTVTSTLIAIVGAVAALIQFTPSGQAGGFIFKSIPWIASLAVGTTAYRTFSNYCRRD